MFVSLIHAAADFQQNVRRPCRCRNFMMCYSAHRFFFFSISPEHNVGGMQPLDRNEWVKCQLAVLPSMAIIIFRDILCCTAHIPPICFSPLKPWLWNLEMSDVGYCGSCIERIVILYDEIECDWQDWTETVYWPILQTEGCSCQLAWGQYIMPHFLLWELYLCRYFYIASFVYLITNFSFSLLNISQHSQILLCVYICVYKEILVEGAGINWKCHDDISKLYSHSYCILNKLYWISKF